MLVYVMGAGRSGTTALDIMLGNQQSCFSMGEIRKFFDEEGVAVGRRADDTVDFWRQIYTSMPQSEKDLYCKKKYSSDEYHLHLVKTFLKSKFAGSSIRDYGVIWNSVFERVRSASGKRILVDSSKYPGRAMMLESTIDETAIVYLIRKRSDVVRSFRKQDIEQPGKSVFAANLYYFLNRMACSTVFFLSKRRKIKINFDSLQSSPHDVVNRICLSLGIDRNEDILDDVINDKPIPTGHLFDGNRLRLNKHLVIGGKNRKL